MHAEFSAPDRSAAFAEAALETPVLIAHIVERYHETHRRELPELIAAARKVERVHHGHAMVPRGLGDLLSLIFDDLEAHQLKEEQILFPMMLNGAGAMVRHPIARMVVEHEDVEAELGVLEETADGFVAPADACATWRRLYEGCRKFRDDLRQHIRIEDTVLFPRFLG